MDPFAVTPCVVPLVSHVARAVGGFSMLEEVVRWSFARTPPRDITEVVVQDEFTHDVVIAWDDEIYLVFDAT